MMTSQGGEQVVIPHFDPAQEISPFEQYWHQQNMLDVMSNEVKRLRENTTTLKDPLNRLETDNAILQTEVTALEMEASLNPVSRYYNERGLHRHFDRIMEENPHAKVAVFAIDLGSFKAVNDEYGHKRGDELLREVGNLFRMADTKALVANPHGDEFVVVTPIEKRHEDTEISDEEVVASIVTRLKGFGDVLALQDSDLQRVGFSISAGGVIHQPRTDLKRTLEIADAEMYRDKRESLPPLEGEDAADAEELRAIYARLAARGKSKRLVDKYL